MPKLASALIAEAIGVFGLCFVGIMAIHNLGGVPGGLMGIALAHGLILAIMISIFAATSGGHHNPAVTIGLLIGGKIKIVDAVLYIVAQCIGGILAGLAVMWLFPDGATIVLNGTPTILNAAGAPNIDVHSAVHAEMITTAFLLLAVWGTAVDPRAPKIGGFGIGLTVAADILAIGPLTGAAMNPARAFGPAVAASFVGGHYDWSHMWIYWVGPIFGAIIASVIYRWGILPKEPK